ncbi:hypothetical protein QJS04_geneDACA025016 [Acorus gramineus]|uniref:XK-related protein n=1 Tax=Acorus gramineus TaxID=55184 RepID=A0AAV9A6J9_ACOGR|nr:hypothetical protein QJS04_geneDACA025016 [Acorus gramineus]
MSATLIYTICTDGSPFRRELLTPWMVATLVDFYINVFAIAVWVAYKEQTWITALLWIVMLVCLGSITTCAYIVVQLFHLSSNDPVQDSLLRETDRVDRKLKIRCSVVMGRILFSVLGCLMFAILVYTLITDGSPFRKEILTPWMNATLVDFYINVIALSVCLVIQFSWIKLSAYYASDMINYMSRTSYVCLCFQMTLFLCMFSIVQATFNCPIGNIFLHILLCYNV